MPDCTVEVLKLNMSINKYQLINKWKTNLLNPCYFNLCWWFRFDLKTYLVVNILCTIIGAWFNRITYTSSKVPAFTQLARIVRTQIDKPKTV